MTDVDLAWEEFLDTTIDFDYKNEDNESTRFNPNEIPKATDIYISTNTIIGYVNTSLNLFDIFWQIPILFYQISSRSKILSHFLCVLDFGRTKRKAKQRLFR